MFLYFNQCPNIWGFLENFKTTLFKKSDFWQICIASKMLPFCLVPKGIRLPKFYPLILWVLTTILQNFKIFGEN